MSFSLDQSSPFSEEVVVAVEKVKGGRVITGLLEALRGNCLLESGEGFSLQAAYRLLCLRSPSLNQFWPYRS